jgi:hypothetical protein
VWDGTRAVSPTRILRGDIQRPLSAGHRGICEFEVAAIGSGILVRCSFLQLIGGFDPKYWLDSADRKLFAQIWAGGGKVYVSEARLEHELSVFDFDRRVSETRYDNILKYEWMFQREYKRKTDHVILLVRLVYRSFRLLLTVQNKKYSVMTIRQCLRVLRHLAMSSSSG